MSDISIYHIPIKTLNGLPLELSKFEGKNILIVNVASECGFTPQYGQLQELYDLYPEKLEIIGCPCNDFGGQEPGSSEEIAQFCSVNYGVTFPISQKISITSDPHPLYKWLTDKSLNGKNDHKVEWNFHKFLIGTQGELVGSYASGISPLSDEILQNIR
jgi:glutathione peroxidase